MVNELQNMLFPTFVVGSFPRPQWIRDLIEIRKTGKITEEDSSKLLDDAIPMVIRMQEQAGLDFISDGEWRRESYVKIFSDAVDGFQPDLIEVDSSGFSNITYPTVVSSIRASRPITINEVIFLKRHTNARIIVAIPSPYTIGRRLWSPKYSRKAYSTREEFMDACIPIIHNEIKRLAKLNVDAIQLDDPWLALLVDPNYRERERITDIEHEIELSVKCVNAVTKDIRNVLLSMHLCHAHFNRRHSTKGPYDLIINALKQMNVQRFAMEFATPAAGGIEVLKNFPRDKHLGLGVIDHTNQRIETPQQVVDQVERVMEFIPKEHISLNPDCGFSPSSVNPMDLDEAYLKLKSMCLAANTLKTKYG